MVKVFGEYTSTVEPTIVVAIISGLGAIVVNAISKHIERKSQLFIKFKDKMTDTYESFLTELTAASSDEDAKAVFIKYKSIFAINSSDDTYKEFLTTEHLYEKEKNVDRLIISIRNDLRVSTKKNKSKKK